jgi:hypothetical protein
MLDVLLANQLVRALVPGTHLLLVGDPDQLPSVGAGDVLANLLRSDQFPVTTLTHILRQGAGSGIALNARRVNAGELPRFGGDIHDCLIGGRVRELPGRIRLHLASRHPGEPLWIALAALRARS